MNHEEEEILKNAKSKKFINLRTIILNCREIEKLESEVQEKVSLIAKLKTNNKQKERENEEYSKILKGKIW